jgi:hypothetical protein
MSDAKAKHFSSGKLGIDQIPLEVIAEVGLVYTYGEGKYGRDNWLKGTDWSEFAGSLFRHYTKFMLGEDIDPETGLPHLAHLIWNAIAIETFRLRGLGVDDRYSFMGSITEMMEEVGDRVEAFKQAHPENYDAE